MGVSETSIFYLHDRKGSRNKEVAVTVLFQCHTRALCINTDRMAFMSFKTKPMEGRPKQFGTGMVETLPECGGWHELRHLNSNESRRVSPTRRSAVGTKRGKKIIRSNIYKLLEAQTMGKIYFVVSFIMLRHHFTAF